MSDELRLAAFALGAYVLGSIPFGVLFARLRGVDVRQAGSGNIGATNVARTVGKSLGVVVLVLDAAKGALPMLLGQHLAQNQLAARPAAALLALGIAPILGHCFSPWLRFRGGKGVATSLGMVLVLEPALAGLAVGVFGLVFAATRIASVSSLAASVSLIPLFYLLAEPPIETALVAAAVAIIIVQHRSNLQRLLSRSELKV